MAISSLIDVDIVLLFRILSAIFRNMFVPLAATNRLRSRLGFAQRNRFGYTSRCANRTSSALLAGYSLPAAPIPLARCATNNAGLVSRPARLLSSPHEYRTLELS